MDPTKKPAENLGDLLHLVLGTQEGFARQQLEMDAQLHALQIVVISMTPEPQRPHVAQVLQETFEEQKKLRLADISENPRSARAFACFGSQMRRVERTGR